MGIDGEKWPVTSNGKPQHMRVRCVWQRRSEYKELGDGEMLNVARMFEN